MQNYLGTTMKTQKKKEEEAAATQVLRAGCKTEQHTLPLVNSLVASKRGDGPPQ